MTQATHQGIEIEMEMHQLTHGYWKCDYTLIKHPKRIITIHHGDKEFLTMELARESACKKLATQWTKLVKSSHSDGELVTVEKVAEGRIELQDGRILPANYRQFAYGYAVTPQGSQGKGALLRRQKLVQIWHDRKIEAGGEGAGEISST